MRGPSKFTLRDVRRAVRAAQELQLPIAGIKVEKDGGFTLLIGARTEPATCWDEAMHHEKD
jgi:hypothetical protein